MYLLTFYNCNFLCFYLFFKSITINHSTDDYFPSIYFLSGFLISFFVGILSLISGTLLITLNKQDLNRNI
jgi:hypothetical protein